MFARALALALAALAAVLAAAASPAQAPPKPEDVLERAKKLLDAAQGASRFVRYDDLLNPQNVVVFGTLKTVVAERRKRVDDADVVHPGLLGNLAGRVVSRVARASGSRFYHARGRSQLLVDGVLFGHPPSDRLQLRYRLQLERTAGGKTRHVLLGAHPAAIQRGVFGVWILAPRHKPKGSYEIRRLIPHVAPGAARASRPQFKKKQGDVFEVNAHLRLLRDAIAVAEGFHEAGKDAEARTVLDEALADKLRIRSLEFEAEAERLVKPYRRKVERMLQTLRQKLAGEKGNGAPA